MVSEQFRRQLRREAEQWRVDGLVSPEQYQRLAAQYEFEALEAGARDRFIFILIGLGSVLLGVGIITFVAANWQAIPRGWKLTLLMGLFLVVNITGFYLWKRPLHNGRERWQHRLGHGLLILGALILGANLALTGQMFHRSGTAYELCLVWGLGVMAMAFGLRLVSLGSLSFLLLGVGFWWGTTEISRAGALLGLNLLMANMPLIAGVLLTLLAYWCRSRVIFVMGAIALISSLEVVLIDLGRLLPDAPGILVAIAFALPVALLWSYDDALWDRLFRKPIPLHRPFRSLAQGLALIFLTLLTYGLSYHWSWEASSSLKPLSTQWAQLGSVGGMLLLNPNLMLVVGLTLVGWFFRLRPAHAGARWGLAQRDAVLLVLIGAIALISFWHWSVHPIQAIATLVANVILFLLAASYIRQGLAQGNRFLFWCGMVALTLQILSRVLEYDTGLLLKSMVFLLCGIGVITIGLWFERYVRHLNQPAVLSPTPSEETL